MVVEMIASIERIFMSNQVIRCIVLFLTVLILGFIDYSTGYEYSFSVFYLIPVSLAVWYASSFLTIVMIVASAVTWIFADFIAGHNYYHGDSILSALSCIVEGKEVNPVHPADVAPVVHGRWEYIPQTLNTLSKLRCSFCGW